MAKKQQPDELAAYLEAAKPARSRRCATCSEYTHLLDYIERFAKGQASGKIALTKAQFYREFLKPRGYALGESSLCMHIRRCLGVT